MKKFSKGHGSKESVHDIPKKEYGMKQEDNGSMDYMKVQDKFCSEDAKKLRRNEFKYDRYK